MMRLNWAITFLICCSCLSGFGQKKFQTGYYIDNEGVRIEGLIRNVVWKNNPENFSFKKEESSKAQIISISEAKEFKVSQLRYVRAEVEIDKSVEIIRELDYNKNPFFEKEILFLRVLVDGEANLYSFENRNVLRFFYSIKNSETKQLVYKKYLVNIESEGNDNIAENLYFRSQLYTDLSCKKITLKEIEGLRYVEKELINFFVSYNSCTDDDYQYVESKKKAFLDVYFKGGFDFNALSIVDQRAPDRIRTDLGTVTDFTVGIGLEYTLPLERANWTVLLEPSYHAFNEKDTLGRDEVNIKLKTTEVALTLRRYFEIKESRLFLGLTYLFNRPFGSRVDGRLVDFTIKKTSHTAGINFGYLYKDKIGLEFRYGFERDHLTNLVNFTSSLNVSSLLLVYKL